MFPYNPWYDKSIKKINWTNILEIHLMIIIELFLKSENFKVKE